MQESLKVQLVRLQPLHGSNSSNTQKSTSFISRKIDDYYNTTSTTMFGIIQALRYILTAVVARH